MNKTDTGNKKLISICILTYNRCELLSKLLTDLKQLKYKPLEIIVVDNNSTDGTSQILRHNYPDIIYYKMKDNIGVAARNYGLQNASGDFIITIDDDIIGLEDRAIEHIHQYLSDHEDVAAMNFKVLDPSSNKVTNWVHHCRDDLYSESFFETYEITEGAVAFRKSALEKAGYYVDYFFISHEGPDLAFRLIDRGYNIIFSPLITVYHYHSQIARKTWRRYYYDARNLIWLSIRHLPFSYGIIFTARGIGALFVYALRDGFTKYFIRAMIDAFRSYDKISLQRKPLKKHAIQKLKKIDKKRPNFFYMLKKRLFRKGIRI